jgi:ATP-binding cassette subfamily C protein
LEQYENHYIAFHILMKIRILIFKAMRKLAPAKLEQHRQGELVSMVKSDVEFLEVFYAHTISPIAIALLSLLFLLWFFVRIHRALMLWALFVYFLIGVVVPLRASGQAAVSGVGVRKEIARLSERYLDLLRGIRELIRFGREKEASDSIEDNTARLNERQRDLRMQAARLSARVDTLCLVGIVGMALLSVLLVAHSTLTPQAAFIAVVLLAGSFTPFINLANLGNTLTHTFAAGERVLSLLEEEPLTPEIKDGRNVEFGDLEVSDLAFSYPSPDAEDQEAVLNSVSMHLKQNEIVGIRGASGCGKSTLLKLLLRFWDPDRGEITLAGQDLRGINTANLYSHLVYMTQKPVFFSGSIRDNLLIAEPQAGDEELWEALEKAAIAERLRELPNGLDAEVSEMGRNFSGGEQQRIALARCLLRQGSLYLLDEPTSNLDVLSEALILKSLYENRRGKTILMVSHRSGSLSICDRILEMKEGRIYG